MGQSPPRNGFLSWLGTHELAVLFAIAGIAGGVLMFALLADEVGEGDAKAFDQKLLLAMRRPGDHAPIGPPAVQEAARDITALGGVTVLGLVTAFTAIFLALDGKKRMALFVCAAVVGGLFASTILKDVFQRPRPTLVPYAAVPYAAYASSYSFPSGHAMMSAVTYLTLGALLARSHEKKRTKAFFLLVATLLTLMVGVSRVYLGVHWPTDVLAGWMAGAVWALLCSLAARRLQSTRALEQDVEHGIDVDHDVSAPFPSS